MMPKTRATITGVYGYVPDYILTNAELEALVDTNDEWIVQRTGIKERRILKTPGWATSDMCVEAAKGLLEKTGTKATEIELIIVATVTGDMVFPDTANTVADKIGATNAFGFDINAACSGFLFSVATATQFIEAKTCKKIMVIGADMMSTITDYTDRSTCILFGDGAGAVLLEPCTDGNGIQNIVLKGDGSGRQFLHMKAGGSLHPATAETVANRQHFAYQEGRSVFRRAVDGMVTSVEEVLKKKKMKPKDIDWLVPHQANNRIIKTVGHYLEVPDEKVMVNIEKYGNTTSATIPLVLWEFGHNIQKGQNVVLTAFGGGFTWGAIHLKWSLDGEKPAKKES